MVPGHEVTAAVLTFRVAGVPMPQGSMSAFIRGGRAIVTDQKGPKLKPWREAVRSTAVERMGDEWRPLLGPVRIDLWFAVPKPAAEPKRRRTWPIRRSKDLDKLTRAVLDALTDAGLWGDDAQVVELRAVKDWPEHVQQMSPGVVVRIWAVDSAPPSTTGQIPLLTERKTGDHG